MIYGRDQCDDVTPSGCSLPGRRWGRRTNTFPAPLVYRVLHASAAQTRADVAMPRGLTPDGRPDEVALVQRRWDQAKTVWGRWC